MPDGKAVSGTSKFSTDEAAVQIREVIKWLIGAFASVGVALAAGSQLAEIGHLSDKHLILAGVGVLLTLAGIAVAILYAAKVLTPKAFGLEELVAAEKKSALGKRIKDEPDLLMGHGRSIAQFKQKRGEAITEANKAWTAYEKDENDAALRSKASRTQEEKTRINETMQWLFSLARYTETKELFRRSLRVMVVAGLVAAIGITTFAWAAHPEDKKKKGEAAIVAKAPALIEVDLSREGKRALVSDLGENCSLNLLEAIAVGGSAETPEVVSVPSAKCKLDRFVLTGEIGTYKSLEPLVRSPDVPSQG